MACLGQHVLLKSGIVWVMMKGSHLPAAAGGSCSPPQPGLHRLRFHSPGAISPAHVLPATATQSIDPGLEPVINDPPKKKLKSCFSAGVLSMQLSKQRGKDLPVSMLLLTKYFSVTASSTKGLRSLPITQASGAWAGLLPGLQCAMRVLYPRDTRGTPAPLPTVLAPCCTHRCPVCLQKQLLG